MRPIHPFQLAHTFPSVPSENLLDCPLRHMLWFHWEISSKRHIGGFKGDPKLPIQGSTANLRGVLNAANWRQRITPNRDHEKEGHKISNNIIICIQAFLLRRRQSPIEECDVFLADCKHLSSLYLQCFATIHCIPIDVALQTHLAQLQQPIVNVAWMVSRAC